MIILQIYKVHNFLKKTITIPAIILHIKDSNIQIKVSKYQSIKWNHNIYRLTEIQKDNYL